MDAFQIRNLTFAYPEQAQAALTDVSFSVPEGAFCVLAGPSGCGKTTLLRLLKPALAPHGTVCGEIRFMGEKLAALDARRQSAEIGFVQQSPDKQIVTDKVWHELAFGLESLGMDTPSIRARVAEMASFFGIQSWFYRDVATLSGGQKQLLNLASVMAMQPRVLILDEPTSQLDPIAAEDFLATVSRINRELGTTVILTEHRLDAALPGADMVVMLDGGRLSCTGTPQEVGRALRGSGSRMYAAMPAPMRIWSAVEKKVEACPVTVRQGRLWLEKYAAAHPLHPLPPEPPQPERPAAVQVRDVWFRYEKDTPDVVRDFQLTVGRGAFYALLGGNGAGKTTALHLLAGLRRPYRGKIALSGRAALLPQDPQTLFVHNTVRQELYEAAGSAGLDAGGRRAEIAAVIRQCRLGDLLGRHPYDLSGGEQQRTALAMVLLHRPDILLLDEPTKGLDAGCKGELAVLLHGLCKNGVTVVMVSHDVEFCAEHADQCGLFFDGNIVSAGTPREFFSGNSFYTTAASRMARQILPSAVTCADVITACGGSPELPPEPPQDGFTETQLPPEVQRRAGEKLPGWRMATACVSGAAALAAFLHVTDLVHLQVLFGTGYGGGIVLLLALAGLIASIGRRGTCPPAFLPQPKREKLPKRTICAAVMILLCIPLTVLAGVYLLGDRKYVFISLLVLLETMAPFALAFEGRKPKTRELVTIAVLCALGVAGRAAFFMLPQFKPVVAVAIIAGVALGGETGFLVGAVTMLVSDMFFGQGPWTPWQMFALGLIGFLSGVLFKKGLLRRDRFTLSVYGALCALVIYGGIINPASAIMWQPELNVQTILAYYVSGFPMDAVLAVATAVFLWVFGEAMLE